MSHDHLWARITATGTRRRVLALLLTASVLGGLAGVLGSAQASTPSQTIFGSAVPTTTSDPDAQAVEVGVKFQVLTAGKITGIRFYKGSLNTGRHRGDLWSSSGKLLASVMFSSESSSGWQTATFTTPYLVTPGVTYVAAYHTHVGHYADDDHYFANKGAGSQQVQALADGVQGGNGVYAYTSTRQFPSSSWQQTNYYVDVTFVPSSGGQATTTTAAPTTTKAPATTTTVRSTTTTKAPATTTTTAPATTTTTPKTPLVSGFTVPCALTAAASSCWAQHTGVYNGTGFTEAQILAGASTLKHVVGDQTITTNGTVISHEWIDGCIAVKASNVTIEDSLIHTQDGCTGGDGSAAPSAINSGGGEGTGAVTGLQIVDTDVDGMNANFDYSGVSAANYTCTRCNVYGFIHNFWAGQDVVIQDSYSARLSSNNGSLHTESVDADSGSHVTLEHDYLASVAGTDSVTGAFMNGGSWGPADHITVDSSYLQGGAGADMVENCGATYIVVTNTAFSSNNGYSGSDFIYGYSPSQTGTVWTGNYIPETGQSFPQPSASC